MVGAAGASCMARRQCPARAVPASAAAAHPAESLLAARVCGFDMRADPVLPRRGGSCNHPTLAGARILPVPHLCWRGGRARQQRGGRAGAAALDLGRPCACMPHGLSAALGGRGVAAVPRRDARAAAAQRHFAGAALGSTTAAPGRWALVCAARAATPAVSALAQHAHGTAAAAWRGRQHRAPRDVSSAAAVRSLDGTALGAASGSTQAIDAHAGVDVALRLRPGARAGAGHCAATRHALHGGDPR